MTRWRHYALVVCFVAIAAALVARMVYLNVTERDFLKRQGDARSLRTETMSAYRGMILDRNGEPLAVSTPVVSVWLDPTEADFDGDDIVRLAATIQLDPRELRERFARFGGREFMYVKRRVTPAVADAVAALNIRGVHFQREYKRYYPAAETIAHVVGITNVDEQGQEGVELAFDDRLRGAVGKKRVLKDRLGQTIKDVEYVAAPQFGADLTLSIDLRLQFFAYRELKSAVERSRARSASLVMLDARTGEILALVNQPSFNPNQLTSGLVPAAMTKAERARLLDMRRNRATNDTYEPGSTVKPFTMIAALESGRFSERSRIDTTPGFFRVGRKLVQDPVNRGVLTLPEVLARSSQVGVAKIALALDERAVYEVFVRAGLGDATASGLPNEATGKLSDLRLRSEVVRATLAYGYGLTVTPLQLAHTYLTLATGGVRLPMSILRIDSPPQGERVFDASIVRRVVHMMEGVATGDGTAPKAQVAGYRIAGKTGTARKVGAAGYDEDRHVAFFAGLAPVDDPRIVVVVVVNEPQGQSTGGGEAAAPIFARVVTRALRLLSVEPTEGLSWPTAV
jgi:cell division protein FtsI (penicillin-binding protein 3)